jgi:hypothetical protein
VTFTSRRANKLRNNFGTDRVLGHIGGGVEYRFTPNIGTRRQKQMLGIGPVKMPERKQAS